MSHHFMYVYDSGDIPTGMTLQEWRRTITPVKPPGLVELLLRGLGLHMSDEDYEATMRHLDDVVAGSE